jgi:hypothetical protein
MKKIKQFSTTMFDVDGQIFKSKNGVKAVIRAYNRKNKTSLKIEDFDLNLIPEPVKVEDLKVGDYIHVHKHGKSGVVKDIESFGHAEKKVYRAVIECQDGCVIQCQLSTGGFKVVEMPEQDDDFDGLMDCEEMMRYGGEPKKEEPEANLIKEVSKRVFEIKEFFEFGNGEHGDTKIIIDDSMICIDFEYCVNQESDIGDIYEIEAGFSLSVEHLNGETRIIVGYADEYEPFDVELENAGIEIVMDKIEELAGKLEPVNDFEEVAQ